MRETTLTCDQAIFTSIRTAMGEGYRLVAATRGLKPEEKQAITRCSPSHDALCLSPDGEEYALAFYLLPTGRCCVAYSCFAGGEHTGRGGQRVYTHNLIFDAAALPDCGYNPFNVVRAMHVAGLTTPQLKPEAVLQPLELSVRNTTPEDAARAFAESLAPPHSLHVLQQLLNNKSVFVDIDHAWCPSAEVLLLGLPGSIRAKTSFSAGLRFSSSRRHKLQLFHDAKKLARSRIAGQPIGYVDPSHDAAPTPPPSEWATFVQRHWDAHELAGLAERTSRPFEDVSATGRERIGALYNAIDNVSQCEPVALLRLAQESCAPQVSCAPQEHLVGLPSDVDGDLRGELLAAIAPELLRHIGNSPWSVTELLWPSILTLWRQSPAGTAFAQPLIDRTLRTVVKENPLTGAKTALDVARDVPPGVNVNQHDALLSDVLNHFALWLNQTQDSSCEERSSMSEVPEICTRWRKVRPSCPVVRTLGDCLAAKSLS